MAVATHQPTPPSANSCILLAVRITSSSSHSSLVESVAVAIQDSAILGPGNIWLTSLIQLFELGSESDILNTACQDVSSEGPPFAHPK